jgi:hypothetical protein
VREGACVAAPRSGAAAARVHASALHGWDAALMSVFTPRPLVAPLPPSRDGAGGAGLPEDHLQRPARHARRV